MISDIFSGGFLTWTTWTAIWVKCWNKWCPFTSVFCGRFWVRASTVHCNIVFRILTNPNILTDKTAKKWVLVYVCLRPSVLGILDFGPEWTKSVDIIITSLYSSDFETRELKSRVISVFVAIRSTKSKFIKITPGACLKSFLLNSFLPNHSGAISSDFLKKRMILSKSHSYRKSLGKAMP